MMFWCELMRRKGGCAGSLDCGFGWNFGSCSLVSEDGMNYLYFYLVSLLSECKRQFTDCLMS